MFPNRRLLRSQVLREMLAGSWLRADPQRFRPPGEWSDDDFEVLADGSVVSAS